MGIIWHLAAKEFKILLRDKVGLFWAFGFPVLMALFFGALYGTPSGSGRIKLGLIDEDRSERSRQFAEELRKSASLSLATDVTPEEAQARVRQGKLTAYLRIPPGFGSGGVFTATSEVEVGIDPSRRAEEGFLQGLLMQAAVELLQRQFRDPREVLEQVNRGRKSVADSKTLPAEQRAALSGLFDSLEKWSQTPDAIPKTDGGKGTPGAAGGFQPLRLDVKSIAREESGPKSSFDITFPQGVMWGILGTVTAFAIGLVMERTSGTLLRLRLAPIGFGQLLAGKALACFLTCMLIVGVVFGFGLLAFGLHIDQPLFLLLAVVASAACYTGIMMLLSTLGRTQRAVGGIGWGVLMPLTMIGGGTIPVFFMPGWLQNMSDVSPVKWSILGLEGAMWRGFTMGEMLTPLLIQTGLGAVCFGLGVYRVRSQGL